jgi:hypothetical protein
MQTWPCSRCQQYVLMVNVITSKWFGGLWDLYNPISTCSKLIVNVDYWSQWTFRREDPPNFGLLKTTPLNLNMVPCMKLEIEQPENVIKCRWIDRSNKGWRWNTLCIYPLIKRTKKKYKHTHIWGLTINAYTVEPL